MSAHRWLKAIRNSLVLLLPITFIGAMALLLGSFPFAVLMPQLAESTGSHWRAVALLVGDASGGILALCLVVLVSHYLAVEVRGRLLVDVSPALVACVALVNFFIYVRLFVPDASLEMLGARSVLAAIVTAILSAEVFFKTLRVRVPGLRGVARELDPVLAQAVRSIAPAIVTVGLFLLACRGFASLHFDLTHLVLDLLLRVRQLFDSQLPALLIVSAMNQLLWFVGIHGANALDGVLRGAFSFAGDPQQVFDIPRIFFDLYAHIGGSGSTFGLLLAILFTTAPGESRQVAKYALLPSLFNINELLLFGLPIVLNPIYLIPFLLAPLAQITVSYFFVHAGFVGLEVTPIPWMTPPIIGGLLNAGSWHGGALQCLDIAISVLIYMPFVRLAERERHSESQRNLQRAVAGIEALQGRRSGVLDRHDEIGSAARKLVNEFFLDLAESREYTANHHAPRVFLAYQPQHGRDGAVSGVEALLRWRHRQAGFISPAVICALLEEAKRIIPFGRWTVETACAQLAAWKRAGVGNMRVSVNLSPLQLRDARLAAFVGECLQANGLQAGELGLELTESQHIPDDPVSVGTLKVLETMGVHLEMDDFGMGYSSMLYIRRFHFNAIKLDRLLTRDVLEDNNCRDIIASVVQLGSALDLRLIAEYVETQEQQRLLEALGCDAFQGYLYSPALPGDECLAYLLCHGRDAATLIAPRDYAVAAPTCA